MSARVGGSFYENGKTRPWFLVDIRIEFTGKIGG